MRGQVTLGALTVFTQAAAQVQGALQGILGGIQGIYEHGLYLSTLYELLEREPSIHAPEHPAPVRRPFRQGIEFRNVSYGYPGREALALALDGLLATSSAPSIERYRRALSWYRDDLRGVAEPD